MWKGISYFQKKQLLNSILTESCMSMMSDLYQKITPCRTEKTFVPAGLTIVAITYGFARYAYGLFLPEIQRDITLSDELMGIIAGASSAGAIIATIAGASLSGKFGARLPVMLGGSAAFLGMLIIATSHTPHLLTIGVILSGASPGLAYAPLADAIVLLIASSKQSRAFALINSGTSIGVIVSGPAALFVGENWRFAWLFFAVTALLATVWNASVLPRQRWRREKVNNRWAMRLRLPSLHIASLLFGLSTGVYWTFAVDLLVNQGGLPGHWSRLFWIIIGACGLAGGSAGHLVTRLGLKRAMQIAQLILSAAIILPGMFSSILMTSLLSAVTFGAAFILTSGLLGIWSIKVYDDCPSAGVSVLFFLVAMGQLLGPILAGYISGSYSMSIAFIIAGFFSLISIIFTPSIEMSNQSI